MCQSAGCSAIMVAKASASCWVAPLTRSRSRPSGEPAGAMICWPQPPSGVNQSPTGSRAAPVAEVDRAGGLGAGGGQDVRRPAGGRHVRSGDRAQHLAQGVEGQRQRPVRRRSGDVAPGRGQDIDHPAPSASACNTGTSADTPPSTSSRPSASTGGYKPGNAHEASRAGPVGPPERTTAAPEPRSVATTCAGMDVPSRVAAPATAPSARSWLSARTGGSGSAT